MRFKGIRLKLFTAADAKVHCFNFKAKSVAPFVI